MSKKITTEQFLSRFYRNYPEAKIELLNYTAISNPLKIKCLICGKVYEQTRAREFFNHFYCCGSHPEIFKIERLKEMYKENLEFDFVKQVDKNRFVVHHRKCGQDIIRVIANSLDNPFACKYCDTSKHSQMLPIQEVQTIIDTRFFGDIQILDYNGQLEKNHYKCLKCGLIFTQKQVCLMQSRGCPKCDKWKSKGEKFVANLLESHKIEFQEQVSVPELPKQHFDFGVYKQGKICYFIEVQGERHREQSTFKDNLEKIQERDDRKRQYCQKRGIPLYELMYQKGKLKNLDILPLDSTTISVKESTS